SERVLRTRGERRLTPNAAHQRSLKGIRIAVAHGGFQEYSPSTAAPRALVQVMAKLDAEIPRVITLTGLQIGRQQELGEIRSVLGAVSARHRETARAPEHFARVVGGDRHVHTVAEELVWPIVIGAIVRIEDHEGPGDRRASYSHDRAHDDRRRHAARRRRQREVQEAAATAAAEEWIGCEQIERIDPSQQDVDAIAEALRHVDRRDYDFFVLPGWKNQS